MQQMQQTVQLNNSISKLWSQYITALQGLKPGVLHMKYKQMQSQ